jgi:hypothetical protein
MAPPGSYFMPTVQLPDNAQPPPTNPPPGHSSGTQHPPPGVSADWIGPQTGHQPTPYATPYGPPQSLVPSPWTAAMSTPFAAFAQYAPPLPPTNPPAAPGIYGPPPGAPPQHGYAGPYATPAQQFTMPPGYPIAYATPGWAPAPVAYPPPGPPPPAVPPRQPERLTRAERYDKIGHFAAGAHCTRCIWLLYETAVTHAVRVYVQMAPFWK